MPRVSPVGSLGVDSDEEMKCSEMYENTSVSPRSRRLRCSLNSTIGERLKVARKLISSYPGRARSDNEITGFVTKTDEEGIHSEAGTKSCTMAQDFYTFFREHAIIMELKHLSQNPLGGVYAIPSLKSLQVWHGIIFIRGGPYKDGIFRFVLFLQDDFPYSRPLLKFTSPVFHPQVHPTDGAFNLDVSFPQWERGKNSIWQILKCLKSCFYKVDTWGATNEVAANVIHTNLEKFKDKANLCAADAVRLFDWELKQDSRSDDDGNVLRQKNLSDWTFREGKRMMLTGEHVSWDAVRELLS